MEATLWRTTAAFYNANLRNIAGPYDRSYGMDMQCYVSVVGLWLRTVMDEKHAPLPQFTPPVDHVGDLWTVPALVVLDARIPPDAMQQFLHLDTAHAASQRITDERIATAWIGTNIIYGAEATAKTRGVEERSQFHPVTMQWQMPNGKIGWMKVTRCPPIDATATEGKITLSTSGDITFRLSVGDRPGDLSRESWTLPGLRMRVVTDASSFEVMRNADTMDVTYKNVTKMSLLPIHMGEAAKESSRKAEQ